MKNIYFLQVVLFSVVLVGSCNLFKNDEPEITKSSEDLWGTWYTTDMEFSTEVVTSSDQVMYQFFREGIGELTVTGDHSAVLTSLIPRQTFNHQSGFYCEDSGTSYDSEEECEENCSGRCQFYTTPVDVSIIVASNMGMIDDLDPIDGGIPTELEITSLELFNAASIHGEHATLSVVNISIDSLLLGGWDDFDWGDFVDVYMARNPTYTYNPTNFSISIPSLTLYKQMDSRRMVTVSGSLAPRSLTIPANVPTEIDLRDLAFSAIWRYFNLREGWLSQLTLNSDGTFSAAQFPNILSGTWTADNANITLFKEYEVNGVTNLDTFAIGYLVDGDMLTFIVERRPCANGATDIFGNLISPDDCMDEIEESMYFDEGSLTGIVNRFQLTMDRSGGSWPLFPMNVQAENTRELEPVNQQRIQMLKRIFW